MVVPMDIGARIKQAREDAGLSQKELGKRIGVSGPAIAQWEAGRTAPQTSRIREIAEALNVPITDIISGEVPIFKTENQYTVRVIRGADGWDKIAERGDINYEFLMKCHEDVLSLYGELGIEVPWTVSRLARQTYIDALLVSETPAEHAVALRAILQVYRRNPSLLVERRVAEGTEQVPNLFGEKEP